MTTDRHTDRSSDPNTRGLRTIVTWNTKTRDVKKVERFNIQDCTDLIGKKIEVMVPGEFKDTKREVTISKLYPHHAQGVYLVGKEDGPKTELKIGLSIADLVERGALSFAKGYAEVV